MRQPQKNESGFSAVEVVIVLVVLIALGAVGYLVYKNQHKATDKSVTSKTTSSTADSKASVVASGFTDGPGADWQTYTNSKLGFSVQVPKHFLSSNGACEKVSYVYDNYGNKVTSAAHYIPRQAVVPATVVQDGDDFYVGEAYTYQLTNKTKDGSGHELAAGCEKTQTTAAVVKDYLPPNSKYLLSVLPFSVVPVQNEQAVVDWVRSHFNEQSITATYAKNANGDWQDVTLKAPEEMLNFKFELRYYKTQGKLVFLQQGQAAHIQTPNGEDFYDTQIFDSFKLTN